MKRGWGLCLGAPFGDGDGRVKGGGGKAVYHNDGGGQPHHPPQAQAPAQHPTPSVGARPTTRALHPRKATAAHKRGACARTKGRPRGLGLGPANGWAALSKRFGGYPNSAPTGGAALPG